MEKRIVHGVHVEKDVLQVRLYKYIFFKFPAQKNVHKLHTYSKRCNIAELYHCYQVRVKYSHQEFKEGRKDYEIPKDKWIDLERLERVEINGTIEERVRDIFLYFCIIYSNNF